MGNASFDFKQFSVRHDRCAMKVGTDGVLLGAWAALPLTGRLLDIGTGTGLIALMAAQRAPAIRVTAIDIDADAVVQAQENVTASPFASRIEVRHSSLQDMLEASDDDCRFDAIVCNPPFFDGDLLPPDAKRAMARHTTGLDAATLASAAARLLTDDGLVSIILPVPAFEVFLRHATTERLHLWRRTDVRTTAAKPPKRVLATFARKPDDDGCRVAAMTLMHDGLRSDEHALLTRDFYLH